MREAFVDHPDDDLDLPAVVRRKAPARPAQKRTAKPPRRPGIGERAATFVFSHPRQILAALFLTGCGGAIAWNALALQSSRHPAPLFNTREIVLAPEPAPEVEGDTFQPLPPMRPGAQSAEGLASAPAAHESAAHPVPEAAPAATVVTPKAPARSPIAEMIRNGGQPAPAATPPARAPQAAPAAPAPAPVRSAARDPIADMIRMGGPVPTPPANVGRSDPGDIVLAGQRALARLGYSVKVDGLMGSGTRQAIERFEQDRRLPVTGELNARTARELSAASGIAVQ
ncbi:peptidoglycan-binding domain-containing protein [Microvirga sp. VF16]|uniref:peptidoglycan-binding domain-containing protein n=1 Tax=Microvirga sp. VF16 TaxID=2807101 RepID=UPI00193E32C4|nr:peptidoglycan-binding domain-containing protein [Microvirga sp. VF16]QRM28184.1 peptidoglycan-binding protein [Microvirga sp. VF16]